MKKIVVGILAHVDAGKTTLSESLFYQCGLIRQMGRVDNKDAYLDTFELEKIRGITIFSKQAVMTYENTEITLLDTPGHVDFSAEMERTLQVLDYAVLVISGSDGVQSHTRTLWDLLKIYKIPTFIFVNKMDQRGTDRKELLNILQKDLSEFCLPFDISGDDYMESLAFCDESIMESYLERGIIDKDQIQNAIANRKVFPVYFGSSLRQIGVESFLEGFDLYTKSKIYPKEFSAKVFKITRDDQGNRLTHIKINGGTLSVKQVLKTNEIEEKINQIRIYSGEKYETVNELEAGSICAVTGLTNVKPGQGLGAQEDSISPRLEAVLSYQLIFPDTVDARQMLPKLREIEEEEPELRVLWNKILQTISIQVMGTVQLEILQSIILERYQVDVSFDKGQIVYKETVSNLSEGVGHFEPLRHYAEVQLLIEPQERGRGLYFDSNCSEDILDKNWQRLILTHLKEKEHVGVLTGSPITDIKVTLIAGKAHKKHTVGGDFREATYRALRQGLKEAKSILLEPYYQFRLELPKEYIGRAMSDIEKMSGTFTMDQADDYRVILTGEAPVYTMKNYQMEVNAYSKGEGRLSIVVKGYDVCHNSEEVIERMAYDSERDIDNPTGSIFCAKGAGHYIPWNEVKDHMHLESFLKVDNRSKSQPESYQRESSYEKSISLEEIEEIINKAYFANQGKKKIRKVNRKVKDLYYPSVEKKEIVKPENLGEEYLLVDGYNIIFAWPELDELASLDMAAARSKLIDILSSYQSLGKFKIMLVFDAYRVEGRKESLEEYQNIQVVFTAKAQTADQYIEKFAYDHKKKHQITVATSDGLQQIIVRGAGARLISAREFREMIFIQRDKMSRDHLSHKSQNHSKLEDMIDEDSKNQLNKL
ncbi:MAG: TetM/TetW/TetO/TetS family tetracycline resistance ribosomal protection protein [Clostridiales bacterium]|nr:TetM/TetW/TetO/TetS family tetracycline resistance ribosomal protection protein [Clostridiales bacterium]